MNEWQPRDPDGDRFLRRVIAGIMGVTGLCFLGVVFVSERFAFGTVAAAVALLIFRALVGGRPLGTEAELAPFDSARSALMVAAGLGLFLAFTHGATGRRRDVFDYDGRAVVATRDAYTIERHVREDMPRKRFILFISGWSLAFNAGVAAAAAGIALGRRSTES